MNGFPKDVLLLIFDLLPLRQKIRSRAVCKRWHHVLTEETRFWGGRGNFYDLVRKFKDIIPEIQLLVAKEVISFDTFYRIPRIILNWETRDIIHLGLTSGLLYEWILNELRHVDVNNYQYAIAVFYEGILFTDYGKRSFYEQDHKLLTLLFNPWGYRLLKEKRLPETMFFTHGSRLRIPKKKCKVLFSTKQGYDFVVKRIIPLDKLDGISEKILEALVSKPEWWQYIGQGKIEWDRLTRCLDTNKLRSLINKRKGKTQKRKN